MAWDDDSAPPAFPPPGERRWVHPSEQQFRSVPPNLESSASATPARHRWAARWKRLPIGTAVVATATGAVAMFGVINVLGLDAATPGSMHSTGQPGATTVAAQIADLEAGAGLAATRSVGATDSLPNDRTAQVTVTAGDERHDGVIIATDSVITAWTSGADPSEFVVSTVDGERRPATRWSRLAGNIVQLTVPGLPGRPVDVAARVDLEVTQPLFTANDAGLEQTATIASTASWNPSTASCLPVIFGVGLAPGTALWSQSHAFVGFVDVDDPSTEDALTQVLTVPDGPPQIAGPACERPPDR